MLKTKRIPKRTRAVIQARGAGILFSDGMGRNHKRKQATIDRDLFDGHSVTLDDIRAWLAAVPRLDPDSPRAARYVAAYDVPGKIKAAKAAGTFWTIIATKSAPRGF